MKIFSEGSVKNSIDGGMTVNIDVDAYTQTAYTTEINGHTKPQ